MPTYEKVVASGAGGAGNVDGRNVYRAFFGVNACSDQPQLQAWDNHDMNTVVSESLQGTVNNGQVSQLAAAHTTNIKTGGPWAPASASAGEGAMQDPNAVGTSHRANRLRGSESYLSLYDVGDAVPGVDEERLFQLTALVHDDNVQGTAGHLPVLAVKTFYAGAAPVVDFYYNNAIDDVGVGVGAVWTQMTSALKGVPMAISIQNTVHFTGPGTIVTALDPVVKPGTGEKAAEQQWIQTAL